MLIYEVNMEVDEDINYKVAGWLSGQIEKMLTFKGFKMAYWFFRKPEDENIKVTNKIFWTIQYVVGDRASLDNYLKEHEAKMHVEANTQFGGKMNSNARTLYLLNIMGSPDKLETVESGT
jgi:hypothetical protein